jgi:hypothetical protein
MAPAVVVALVVVVLALIAYGAHRALRWAERRGYVYYLDKPQRRPPSLGLLDEIYAPDMEHVVEEAASQYVRAEEDESGSDRDDPGGPENDPSE